MASMVMTSVEAFVAQERWTELEQAFTQMDSQRPTQLVTSFLVQGATDPTLWRIIGIWRSREAFEEYRASVATPGAIQLLSSVGAAPTFGLFEVKRHQE